MTQETWEYRHEFLPEARPDGNNAALTNILQRLGKLRWEAYAVRHSLLKHKPNSNEIEIVDLYFFKRPYDPRSPSI